MLNTYTLTPKIGLEKGQKAVELRTFVQNVQNGRAPEKAIIVIREKTADHDIDKTRKIVGYSTIQKGIPKINGKRLAIYSRGYAYRETSKSNTGSIPRVGGGIVAAYTHSRDNIIPMPCVAFDHQSDRKRFNFGQKLDQECLKTIYDTATKNNPHAKITFIGDCVGGLTTLGFIANNPETTKKVDTIVLESLTPSARGLIKQISDSYVKKYLGKYAHPILNSFFKWYLPNYKEKRDNLIKITHNITGKKIIIYHLATDTVVSSESIDELVKKLRENNDVYLVILQPEDFEGKAPYHSRLTPAKKVQQTTHAFYKKYNIVHDKKLAQKGKCDLKNAHDALVLTQNNAQEGAQ